SSWKHRISYTLYGRMYHYAYILVGQFHLMPPEQRGEELKKIIKSVRDGTFEYDSKEPGFNRLGTI
ncbi:MAG: hypothetical protein U9N36_06890, partial [Euryarchaeota archaeon]|nr:hypothetical protein [Euryarchaeota archaeon]